MAGNSVFQFKQFSIHQDRCAMKVTSDACIFGAWINLTDNAHVLDIGTGTGLLSLMTAQRYLLKIDALEIDEEAAHQALENINASPWKDRITIHHTSLSEFILKSEVKQQYDHLICNPPFYNKSSKSENRKKRLAWHDDALELEDLIASAVYLLKEEGRLHLMLPFAAKARMEYACHSMGLHPTTHCGLKSFPDRPPHRLFANISHREAPISVSELVVYDQPSQYSHACQTYLKPYLLHL